MRKKLLAICILVAIITMPVTNLNAIAGNNSSSAIAAFKNIHPRVYFTSEDIPRILENADKPQNIKAWNRFEGNLNVSHDGTLQDGKYYSNILNIIECRAFDYAIRNNESSGDSAVSALKNVINSLNYDNLNYTEQGYLIYTIGIVYDWCYEKLTSSDKTLFYNTVIDVASSSEINYPDCNFNTFNGHGAEGIIQRDLMAAAIAMYDEYPVIWENISRSFFDEFVNARKFYNQAHMFLQGSEYTGYRIQWDALCTYMLDTIGIPNVYGDNEKDILTWMLYSRRPDGHTLNDGDTNRSNEPQGSYDKSPYRAMMHLGNYYKNPYLKGEALRENIGLNFEEISTYNSLSCVEFLILNDPDLEGKSVNNLPLSKYFPSPKGGMIARTGWDEGYESPAVVAEMKINEFYSEVHQHLDAGAFQIYYKGALANDTGYYQSSSAGSTEENSGNSYYWSLHNVNYYRRTIAHNCMLIADPSEEKNGKYDVDGGQRSYNFGAEINSISDYEENKEKYRMGYVLGREFGLDPIEPNYTYLKGDIAPSYYGKAEGYERSFMFLNLKNSEVPAAMIVFDRVISKDPGFKKTWLLHGLNEPEINGNRSVFKDTRENYNGKLTVDTLLPSKDNLNISAVGGEEGEYLVNGTNYFAIPMEGGINEGGGYRLEISPKTQAKEDYFLNVLQVSDADKNNVLPVEKIDAGDFVGAKISDRVVLMGKFRDRTENDVEFSFDGQGEFEITVADLKEGSWSVYKDGEYLLDAVVEKDGGIAVVNGTSGSYSLEYSSETGEREKPVVKEKNEKSINIMIGDMFAYSYAKPFRYDGKLLLPLITTYEYLTDREDWNEGINSAISTSGSSSLNYAMNKVGINNIVLEPPFAMKNGYLMVSPDFVKKSLGCNITWDDFSNTLKISK